MEIIECANSEINIRWPMKIENCNIEDQSNLRIIINIDNLSNQKIDTSSNNVYLNSASIVTIYLFEVKDN